MESFRSLINLILICMVIIGIPKNIKGQFMGLPMSREITFAEYGAGGQNYQIDVDQEGVIYMTNNFGLLRFNGTDWELFPVDGGTKVRSIYLSEDGRKYVGAQNEFGYFLENKAGSLSYFSLKSLLPDSMASFEDIWKIHAIDDVIVFSATGTSYLYDMKEIKTITSSRDPGFTLNNRDRLITKSVGSDIKVFDGQDWQSLSNQPRIPSESKLAAIVDMDSSTLWLTRNHGIYQFDGQDTRPFASSCQEELRQAEITVAIKLMDGEIAVGTQSNGLYIFSEDGQLIFHFHKDTGLSSLTVNDLIQDENGALWLSMNNSLFKILWRYPFSFIDEKLGLPGTGYAALAFDQDILLGTNNGLYVSQSEKSIIKIEKLNQIDGQINNLQLKDEFVLVSAHTGVYQWDGSSIMSIDESTGWWGFVDIGRGDTLLGGSYEGMGLFVKENQRWVLVKKYPEFIESSRIMVFGKEGYLWMTHGYKGVYRLQFAHDFSQLQEVKYFGPDRGLPSNYLNSVYQINGETIFTGQTGIFTFDYPSETFIRHDHFDTLIGSDIHTRYMKENQNGDVFVITNKFSGILKRDTWKGFRLERNVFNGIFPLLNDDLAQISIIDEENILFAANTGFVHFNGSYGSVKQDISSKIISVRLLNTDAVIDNIYEKTSTDWNKIPYEDNSISFDYTTYKNQFDKSYYRYKLEGFKTEEWSEWSELTKKEFTNLYEGNYSFYLESKDALGNVSDQAVYRFEILAPWYRTSLAYVIYTVLFLSVFVVSFSLYRRHHKKERSHLIKKQEIQMTAKETELAQLRNDKLKSEISLKKRQLATSTMHLMDKNELLGKIKNQVNNLVSNSEAETKVIKELKKISKEINRNIDQDKGWEQFELYFDEVHGDFLKRLSQAYDYLTPQEIKLSAYLRMNMSTKEIANMLKISVRGVEIARYRLRKKLSLNQGENLVDFMLKF
jgi:DNA-binding CsgD family transcriptional regulator